MTGVETLQAGLAHLHPKGAFEIRCLNGSGGRCVGSPTEALDLNAQGWNVYHTINTVKSDLVGSASDSDITEIRWIPYDIDPIRRNAQHI